MLVWVVGYLYESINLADKWKWLHSVWHRCPNINTSVVVCVCYTICTVSIQSSFSFFFFFPETKQNAELQEKYEQGPTQSMTDSLKSRIGVGSRNTMQDPSEHRQTEPSIKGRAQR